ncbi:MAG: hypothetical protein J3Q66DRAFT_439624 [Benniella sp.]|nr:MAG: hypothetical protein J3Q66DRAFT_439624 [Benniella sp.]
MAKIATRWVLSGEITGVGFTPDGSHNHANGEITSIAWAKYRVGTLGDFIIEDKAETYLEKKPVSAMQKSMLETQPVKELHPRFQSGSSRRDDRRYLVSAMVHATVLVEFYDKVAHRGFHFMDNSHYPITCLAGLTGTLFAAVTIGGNPSTLSCKTYDSWATTSEWQVYLPDGENVTVIALNAESDIVATSRGYLACKADRTQKALDLTSMLCKVRSIDAAVTAASMSTSAEAKRLKMQRDEDADMEMDADDMLEDAAGDSDGGEEAVPASAVIPETQEDLEESIEHTRGHLEKTHVELSPARTSSSVLSGFKFSGA